MLGLIYGLIFKYLTKLYRWHMSSLGNLTKIRQFYYISEGWLDKILSFYSEYHYIKI